MHCITSTTIFLACTPFASADALSDFALISGLADTIGRQIALSLTLPPVSAEVNTSSPAFTRPVGLPYNTSEALRNMTTTITASNSAYNLNQTAFVDGTNATTTDAAYCNYINIIPTLVQGLVARGRAWHNELNRPVYDGMQNLSQAVYAYGQTLTKGDVISTMSTIRTITASGAIVDGMDAWNAPGWLPGS